MKKTIKLLAFFMIVAMLAMTLASCGKILAAKYSTGLDLGVLGSSSVTYDFRMFGKVTRTTSSESILTDASSTVVEGKYEITEDPENPDQLLIVFEFEGEERTVSTFTEGEENGVKFITIGGIRYDIVE